MTTANTPCGLGEEHDRHRMGAEGTLWCDGSPFKGGTNYHDVGKDWACCGLPINGSHLPACQYSKSKYYIDFEYVTERMWDPGDTYHVYKGSVLDRDGGIYCSIEEQTFDNGRTERERIRNIASLLNAQDEAKKAGAVAGSTEE